MSAEAPVGTLSKRSDFLNPQRQARILGLLIDGYRPEEISRKLGQGRAKEIRRWDRWIRQMAAESEEFQFVQSMVSKGAVIEELPEITDALIRRAKRGRTDAVKLLFEIIGFHNPRVDHNHSGEIKLTLASLPRPSTVATGPEAAGLPEPVVDADVVEED